MYITKINFGSKFSENAEILFQKSQDYIAQKSIETNNNDIVILNNLNKDLIEARIDDEFILDALIHQTVHPCQENYKFFLRYKDSGKGKPKFLVLTNLENILNGKVWYKIAEKLLSVNK